MEKEINYLVVVKQGEKSTVKTFNDSQEAASFYKEKQEELITETKRLYNTDKATVQPIEAYLTTVNNFLYSSENEEGEIILSKCETFDLED